MKKLIIAIVLVLSLLAAAAIAEPTQQLQGSHTQAEAPVLAAQQQVLSMLNSDNAETQLQYYAFVSTSNDQYINCTVENVKSTGHSDGFRLNLITAGGSVLQSSAIRSGKTVTLSEKIPAGDTVYAEIFGYNNAINGLFRITFDVVTDAEGSTGVPLVSDEVHSIDTALDRDVFLYKTGETVTYMDLHAINISCEGEWYYDVYDDDNIRIHNQYIYGTNKSADTILRLEPNTQYSFHVYTGKGTGNYRFTFTTREDTHGDAIDSATALIDGEMISAVIDRKDDRDYFALTANDPQVYHCLTLANTSADYTADINVYDSYGQRITKFSATIGKTEQAYFKLPAAGQYYVAVTGSKGGYNLTHTLVPDPEGDVVASALPFAPGAAQQFALEASNDTDYFIVPVAEEERMIGVSFDTKPDGILAHITVTDQYERVLMENNTGNKQINFTVQQRANEALYIRVTSSKAGRYVLQLCAPEMHATAADWTVSLKPTCTEAGRQDKLCLICGDVVISEEIPALGHVCGDWSTEKHATCTQEGLETAKCTRCREKVFSNVIPMLAHTPGDWKTTSKPTCTETGLHEQYCTKCNILLGSEVLPALGHKSGEAKVVKATCTNTGTSTVSCTVCKEVLSTEELPLAKHTAGDWKTVSKPTCTETGLNEQRCTDCNILLNSEVLPATGHKSGTAKVVNATCSNTGSSTVSCTVCNEVLSTVELPLLKHTSGSWKQVSAPTCTDAGRREQYCTVCNILLASEDVDAYGHKAGRVKTTDATCTTAGKTEQYCLECDTLLSSEEIPATGHAPGYVSTTAATCTAAGKTEQYCTYCSTVLSTEEIPATGHVQSFWRNTVAATCTADGERTEYCAECNAILSTVTVAAHGHSPAEWQQVQTASCTEKGLSEQRCSVCDAVLATEETDAHGHYYTEWEVILEATKEAEGEKRRHCTGCGDTQFEVIPKVEKFLGIF